MLAIGKIMLMLAVVSTVDCEKNTPRSARASRNDAALEFECPEEFGYYPHPRDCTQYYVCVFGGALLESCTGGLMYSHELQTCDWPRNVGCQSGSTAQEVEDDDPLLERAAKAESQQRQRQPSSVQRHSQHVTASPSPPAPQITERQSRHRQQSHRTYQDEDYEPASEIESDRQQRVYRGQPSTIGQVQRDRDGLRRNIISVSSSPPSHPASVTTPPSYHGEAGVGNETPATPPSHKKSSAHPRTISNDIVLVSSPSPFKLPPREDEPAMKKIPADEQNEIPVRRHDSDLSTTKRLAQRGREKYHGPNYVTMKVVRKRPMSYRDQDSGDSLKTDVTVPLTRTTPARKLFPAFLQSDDIPTTLSPLKRALILDQMQREQEDVEKNEISATTESKLELSTTPTAFRPSTTIQHDVQHNEITATTPSTQATQSEKKNSPRSSTLEREKESLVNGGRTQTDSHYRAIPSVTPRIVKTTSAPVLSKAYYDPESYPYYTIYDDDVPIYKDDDYSQYSINQSVSLQQPQPPPQQNVRIAEVTPNSKTYTSKPKKVPVNEADKYNFNSEVTGSDYDIYENQGHLNKNKFHISNDQHSYRTNGLSHPVIHVTTPNAIVDSYVPLTTTTHPPSTTTARPYTATVQNRVRPQVNRGTAPPRIRPTLKPSTEVIGKVPEFIDIYRHPPSRPAPIYPTPQVDKPAAKCRKDVCLLPDCNCGGTDIPGDFLPEEIPQIVLLTFDDSVNDLNKGLYADLFEKGRKNPNGCPIAATFYVSHEWTDYGQVQNLYANGHEIASHTVSHSFGEQFSARKWAKEVAGQREILAAYGGVKLEDVKGMRAPFLSVGGNNMFKMLWESNFTYDSSLPVYENRPPSWPYTLDYKLFHDCMIPPCPTRSYPGLWEVPMVMWQDLNGGRCSMGDACSNPPASDGVYKMLIKNFERHYTTNRAPFGLFYHAAWFTQPHHKEGFISFLDTIVAMDDVWVVTNWQALQWIRNPTPLAALDRFDGFNCNYHDRPKKCNNPKVCNLWHKSGVRYMKTCQPCPDIYPWTGKTGIRSSRIDNGIEN